MGGLDAKGQPAAWQKASQRCLVATASGRSPIQLARLPDTRCCITKIPGVSWTADKPSQLHIPSLSRFLRQPPLAGVLRVPRLFSTTDNGNLAPALYSTQCVRSTRESYGRWYGTVVTRWTEYCPGEEQGPNNRSTVPWCATKSASLWFGFSGELHSPSATDLCHTSRD